jgi:hypothetical protein
MANLLNVAIVESILSLHALGWSRRRIARELGLDRETVGKYVSERLCGAKPANLPTGSEGSKTSHFAGRPGSHCKTSQLPADRVGSSAAPRNWPRNTRSRRH